MLLEIGIVKHTNQDLGTAIKKGRDSKGSYRRWGGSGKKYYYKTGSKASREKARKKAHAQASAAFAVDIQANITLDMP